MYSIKSDSTLISQQDQSKVISHEISHSDLYWNFCLRLKEELCKKKKEQTTDIVLQETINTLITDTLFGCELKNKIYDAHKKFTNFDTQYEWIQYNMANCSNINELPQFFTSKYLESLQCIVSARKTWDEFLIGRINSVADELRVNIIGIKEIKPPKIEKEKKEIEEKDDDVEVEEKEPEKEPPLICIYDTNQLLSALLKIKSANFNPKIPAFWGSFKVHLYVRTVEELRKKYEELNVNYKQIGVDDDKQFIDERYLIGERLLAKNCIPFIQQFAKRGISPSYRSAMYKKILGIEIGEKVCNSLGNTIHRHDRRPLS